MPANAVGGHPAVFLDRGGVINRVIERAGRPGSPHTLDEFELDPAFPAVVDALHTGGFLVFVVTNQPDVSRGLLAIADLEAMHRRLRASARVDDLRVCLHDDAADCRCRKPRPGMLEELAARWGVNLPRSYVVGDTWRDAEAGRAVGCVTVIIDRPYNAGVESSVRVPDLRAVVARIVNAHGDARKAIARDSDDRLH